MEELTWIKSDFSGEGRLRLTCLVRMVRLAGFEPATCCSGGNRSIHLSYRRTLRRSVPRAGALVKQRCRRRLRQVTGAGAILNAKFLRAFHCDRGGEKGRWTQSELSHRPKRPPSSWLWAHISPKLYPNQTVAPTT